jgi:integrase
LHLASVGGRLLDSYMAEDPLRWRRQSAYPLDHDYVFASEVMQGSNLLARQSNEASYPAGRESERHSQTNRLAHLPPTFGTLLKANGEDVKTVQELLRHANSRITLEVYTQATTSNKRPAQSKVVRKMVPNLGEKKGETPPQIDG